MGGSWAKWPVLKKTGCNRSTTGLFDFWQTGQLATGLITIDRNWQLQSSCDQLQSSPVASLCTSCQLDFETLATTIFPSNALKPITVSAPCSVAQSITKFRERCLFMSTPLVYATKLSTFHLLRCDPIPLDPEHHFLLCVPKKTTSPRPSFCACRSTCLISMNMSVTISFLSHIFLLVSVVCWPYFHFTPLYEEVDCYLLALPHSCPVLSFPL